MDYEIFSPVNINNPNEVMPLLFVTCKHCGHTMFFNGKVLNCIQEPNKII